MKLFGGAGSLARASLCFWLAFLSLGCGSQGASNQSGSISLILSAESVEAPQDGTPGSVQVTVVRPSGDTNSVSLEVSGLPVGVTAAVSSPGTGNSGAVTFTANSAASGTSTVTLQASEGSSVVSANLSLIVSIVATVGTTVNTGLGVNGKLGEFMATSFQPADWDYQFFANNSGATTPLNNLSSQHIRLQPVDGGTPQGGDTTSQTWSFTELDSVFNPVAGVADHSPELQLAVAPEWMWNSNNQLDPTHFSDFAEYSADMVKYYNTTTGFTDSSGTAHVHSTSTSTLTPVAYWGIFNEPNINGLTASQYTQLYNLVVPAMQAAGSLVPIKFVAVELADFGQEPEKYMPTFASGVTAQVDTFATHFYSSCNQKDTDQTVMNTVPGFASDVKYVYSQLQTNLALASVPVWVTENNVNADYDKGGGISACNGTPFVLDHRGTSAFFAAWRPYVFSQLGQAGNQALYHWDYDADQQFGEVDYNSGGLYLSYWVDYWLERYFPSPPGEDILNLNVTETSTVETLAVREADGSVVVMVANHAVHSSSDNNGTGDPRTVVVDLSGWPAFSSATLLTMDANASVTSGPSATSVTPRARMEITLNGYGVAFLKLVP
jgi:hypothetical protein